MRPRSLRDLIRELETEPGQAALVLRLDTGGSLQVAARDPERLRVLATALAGGASPVGFIRKDQSGWSSRVLCEYAGDPSAQDLLRSFVPVRQPFRTA